MKRTIISGLSLVALIPAFVIGRQATGYSVATARATRAPIFQPDPSWLKLPSDLSMSNVSSVTVDKHDHVWFIYRPRVARASKRLDCIEIPRPGSQRVQIR